MVDTIKISPTLLTITALKAFPVCIDREEIHATLQASPSCKGFHESLLRSYQTLQKVKELLRLGTPASVILEIIEEIYPVNY